MVNAALSIVLEFVLPITIPLLLFRADLRQLLQSTGTLLLAFLLGSFATVVGTIVAFLVVPMRSLGQDIWKIAAALLGSYIGGSVNYVAISEALGVSWSVLSAGVAPDNVICAFLEALGVSSSVLFALASKIPPEALTLINDDTTDMVSDSRGKFPVLQAAIAVAISFLICKTSSYLTKVITDVIVILATTFPSQFGYLAPTGDIIALVLMPVFFAVVGASGSIWNVIITAPSIFMFALVQVTVHLVVILGLGKLFRLDLKLLLLASNTNIGGPTTACGMATAKGWGSLVVPGILADQRHNKGKKIISSMKTAFRIILLVVFLGWVIVWVLLRTKTYKQAWTPTLSSKLNSTYFGEQDLKKLNLLHFTFPMIFIAVLGCVYLRPLRLFHSFFSQLINRRLKLFPSNYDACRVTKLKIVTTNRLAFWRRPVLVMAPLGIVTAVELAFAAMFVVLLIWPSLSNYLHVSFGHLHMHNAGEKVWQAKFRSVSLRLGYVRNICWAFPFFPVARGSSILPLVGLTSESSIKYPIWLGHVSMILFATHTVGFIIYWAMTNQMAQCIGIGKLAMWVTSFPRVRRKMFEVLFYTHHLYILFIFFYVLHVGTAYFCMILPGVVLFLVDRFLRFLQSRQSARLVSARILPCDTVELNFSKSQGLNYNPSSIMFINVPSISKFQWHPFTLTSCCNMEPDKLSLVIKRGGSWSQKLFQELSSPVDHLKVSVEGPYGPSLLRTLLKSIHQRMQHESLVMVSGGSGITPFVLYVPRVLLVCAFKNSADLAMLDLLIPISGAPTQTSKMQLQIEVYVTRNKEQSSIDSQKLIQTIWFKPDQSDSLISPALGPNNWLWLGVIISSSFVMFLLLLGIVIRYYIYPIEQNTNETYNFSFCSFWDIFLAFTCILLVSSAIFLQCKKQNARERKQIQNSDVPTPTNSTGLPHQSLVQVTNVHFGARPDLKKVLLECTGSDVGVLVCGPRRMRHEVAKICSSGLAENLHFESISFNW
ncbi:hypothetical protein I3843_05G234900 [Carya illinoinensis]|nr:hypothetical protein I3843_05G234900 [Carya illinoinensis]